VALDIVKRIYKPILGRPKTGKLRFGGHERKQRIWERLQFVERAKKEKREKRGKKKEEKGRKVVVEDAFASRPNSTGLP